MEQEVKIRSFLKPVATLGSSILIGLGLVFVTGGLFAYVSAEDSWSSAISFKDSVGMGTSTYHAISFLRSIALEAMGAAFLIAGKTVQKLEWTQEESPSSAPSWNQIVQDERESQGTSQPAR